MKKLFFTFLFGTLTCALQINAQNPMWSLPSNTYEVLPNSPTPLPNPNLTWPIGYDGRSPSVAHNVQHDASGALLFFIVDGHIFDKDGLLIADVLGGDFGADELVIIPVPNKCNKYYIVGAEYYLAGESAYPRYYLLDMELPGIQTAPLVNY